MSGRRAPDAGAGSDDSSAGVRLPGIDGGALAAAAAVPHGIWVLSASGAVEYANPRALDYAGSSALGAGVSWQSVVHSEDAEEVWHATSSAWPQSEAFEVECRMRRHGGVFRRHSVRFTPAGDDCRQARHWIGTATDIDDRRALQEALCLLEALEAAPITGQGLALARAVLDKHAGSIEVRSAVGAGTEFILRLPIAGKQDALA